MILNNPSITQLDDISVGILMQGRISEWTSDIIKEYENNFPEGNLDRASKGSIENHDLYESKYNLHQQKNSAFEKLLKLIISKYASIRFLLNKLISLLAPHSTSSVHSVSERTVIHGFLKK